MSRRNAIVALGVWITFAPLSAGAATFVPPVLGLPLAGQAPAQVPDSTCGSLEKEAARVASLRDSDAAAGLTQADLLTSRAQAARCPRAEVMAQAARADNLLTLGRYAGARDLYEALTRKLEADGVSVLMASVLRRAGAAYYYMGELDKALERYRRSAAVAEAAGDVVEAAKSLSNVGALYLQIGRHEEALEIYTRALESFRPADWPAGIAGLAINLGQVHEALANRAKDVGDTAEFRRQQQGMYRENQRAHTQFVALGNTRGIAVAAGNLGVAAGALRRHEESLRWQKRALALHREVGDVQGQVSALGSMTPALIALRRLDEAERNLRAADALLTNMPASERQRIARFWVDLLDARGDRKGALDRMYTLLRLNEEVASANYAARVAELEARTKRERMERQIEQLSTEQTIAELRLTRQSLFLGLALLTLVLLAGLFVFLVRSARASRLASAELEKVARTDQLTGLANRRGMYERLEHEQARWQRSKEPFSLAIMDLDDFKSVNDTYGHEIGDAVLIELSKRLATQIRAQDSAGRWGGEEFLLLLPNTGATGAATIAQKVCDGVTTIPIAASKVQLNVSVTIGICEYVDGMTINECIRYADEAMYEGKRAGKSRVVVSDPTLPARS